MSTGKTISFKDNSATQNRETTFIGIHVDVATVLASWRDSVFSVDWLDNDGAIKDAADMKDGPRGKREAIEQAIKDGAPITKSVLGIGLLDNIEIGSARAEFLTLAACGHKTLPVHIPASNEKEFQKFIAPQD